MLDWMAMGKRLTDEERAWRALTEKQFQSNVMKRARGLGWKVSHFHDSRRQVKTKTGRMIMIGDGDAKGFPDLCLIRSGEILFWELKKQLGKTTPEQDEWIAELLQCGLEARVVRPSDFDSYVEPRLNGGVS